MESVSALSNLKRFCSKLHYLLSIPPCYPPYVSKTSYWANFCPKKLYWEFSQLEQHASLPSEWWKEPQLFIEALTLLAQHSIEGIRLNIFNAELTEDGETINWTPIDVALEVCQQLDLKVHLCIGPYQYPLYPGIRLPKKLLTETAPKKFVDEQKKWKSFSTDFLYAVLKKYGTKRNLHGFYLGNEWHTAQSIEEYSKPTQFCISAKHMQTLARQCKKLTKKPIFFNTNFEAFQLKLIEHTFLPFMNILKSQAWIGLDVYPSQEQFLKAPRLWFHRKFSSYEKDIKKLQEKWSDCVIFSEFEAQPWGNGKSWAEQINQNPKVVAHTAQQLSQTIGKYVKSTSIPVTTLWGSEFWIIAHQLGHPDMLNTLKKIST